MAQNAKGGKRTSNLTWQQLQSIADANGVGTFYKYALEKLTPLFDVSGTTHTTAAFVGNQDGQKTIFSIVPGESNKENGLRFRVYLKRFARHFGINIESAASLLPSNKREWTYQTNASDEDAGYEGFFKDKIDLDSFITKLPNKK